MKQIIKTVWAITDKELNIHHIGDDWDGRNTVINAFTDNWMCWRKKGYRCRKATLTINIE